MGGELLKFGLLLIASALTILIFSPLDLAAGESCSPQDSNSCCHFGVHKKGQTKVYRMQTSGVQAACVLNVEVDSPGRRYRRFGFASDGQVSLYILDREGSGGSAGQSFLIYPFNENPSVDESDSGGEVLSLRTGSGQIWNFNAATVLPRSINGCDISVSPNFSVANSGVSIVSCQRHLVITTPIEVGGEYISYKDKKLTVKDPDGKTCEITTSDLYDHVERGPENTKDRRNRYYNLRFKFENNAQLGSFFRVKCPQLDTTMFRTRPPLEIVFDDLMPENEDENKD